MIIQGRQLQQDILENLKARIGSKKLRLDIIYVGENAVIEKYIRAKQSLGEKLGVVVTINRFAEDTSIDVLKRAIDDMSLATDGILIQLPLPLHLSEAGLIEYLDPSLDVDLLTSEGYGKFLTGKNNRLPPVVRGCMYVMHAHGLSFEGKKICILGNGKLVGKPMADFFRTHHIAYDQLTKENFSTEVLRAADIIISGMGAPYFVTSEMVGDGVVILDAGTTEEGGSIVGDVHPDVSSKASLFTPVPGGIGPLTVVALFDNLIEAYES